MAESAEQLVHELTQAGILTSDEVTSYGEVIAVGVDALLERLVQDGRITEYQRRKFLAGEASDIYFGDYIVREEIGRGGMGTVLLARHRRMDRDVAIKILPVTALDSETAVARFYQEVKVAAKLTHPNIVHAYDAGEHHGFHYLVMEYVPGHDLARVLEQLGPLPVGLAIDYVTQAAEGIQYAHRKGIVHRDIKPSNLLLDNEGTVKVLDLGLARVGSFGDPEISHNLTTTGQVMGTVEYMSPEQAEDTRLADHRSDIYSLGCCLYKLVTGTSPFARETVVKTILAHREAPVPQIENHPDPHAARLNPILQKMLAKRPEDRYQSISEVLDDLRQLSDDLELREPEMPGRTSRATSPDQPTRMPGQVPSPTDSPLAYPAPSTGGANARPDASTRMMVSSTDQSAFSADGQSGTGPVNSGAWTEVIHIKPHRGKFLLTMGILSLLTFACLIGVVLAIITLIYARSDLEEMERGLRDVNGIAATRAAKLMGQVALWLALVVFVGGAIAGWFK